MKSIRLLLSRYARKSPLKVLQGSSSPLQISLQQVAWRMRRCYCTPLRPRTAQAILALDTSTISEYLNRTFFLVITGTSNFSTWKTLRVLCNNGTRYLFSGWTWSFLKSLDLTLDRWVCHVDERLKVNIYKSFVLEETCFLVYKMSFALTAVN